MQEMRFTKNYNMLPSREKSTSVALPFLKTSAKHLTTRDVARISISTCEVVNATRRGCSYPCEPFEGSKNAN